MEVRNIPSRDALARSADIHRTNLYKISTGRVSPSVRAIRKLCQVLDCQPGDLLRLQ